MAQRNTSEARPEGGGKALLLIGVVFGFLALVVVGLFAAIKWTEPKQTLMGTTARAEQNAPGAGGASASPAPTPAPATK